MGYHGTRRQEGRAGRVAGLLCVLIALRPAVANPAAPQTLAAQPAASQPARSPADSQPAWQPASAAPIFQMDRFGRLHQAGRPISLREMIQAAGRVPQGTAAVLQYDADLPGIQVREVLAALRQAGLVEITAEPVRLEPPAAGTTQRSDMEAEGLALLQTLADLGRQLPSAIDAAAKSLKDRYRDLSQRAAAASKAAAGAARSFGGLSPTTQPGVVR